MSKPKIILVGAGGHCRSCIDVIEQEGEFEIAGVVDREIGLVRDILGYPVIASDAELPGLRDKYAYALVTVGQMKSVRARCRLFMLLKDIGFTLPNVVSPLSHVSPHAELGEGTIVMHGAIVNVAAIVGRNCILNSLSLVEHDARIADHCHVSTGAIVNGNAKVGDSSFIGSGSVVVQGVDLPAFSFVRAGKLVISKGDCRTMEQNG
jgi:sugar O-acyltransferase (sialic acid O-acetyltransferase NeuD family)